MYDVFIIVVVGAPICVLMWYVWRAVNYTPEREAAYQAYLKAKRERKQGVQP